MQFAAPPVSPIGPSATMARSRMYFRFSNRPFGVKRFQTILHYSVDVAPDLKLGPWASSAANASYAMCLNVALGQRLLSGKRRKICGTPARRESSGESRSGAVPCYFPVIYGAGCVAHAPGVTRTTSERGRVA